MKRKTSGKALVIGIVALVAIVGGVLGAAFMGILKIPGITPKSKMMAGLYGQNAAKLYGENGKDLLAKKESELPPPEILPDEPKPKPKPKPTHTIDPVLGAKKLAKVWNEMPSDKLVAIAKVWKPDPLAEVVSAMDAQKAAELLAQLDAKVAAEVSTKLKEKASKKPIVEE